MSLRDVLLVTVDSLRADHIHGAAAETPTWDTLASEGTTYRSAFAQGPYTTFSMPSIFTSRYPSGLEYVEISDATAGVAVSDVTTIADAFQAAGYETAGFHSNPLLSHLFGFGDGFDTFDARLPFSDTDLLSGRAKVLADKLRRMVRLHPYLPAERINERAFEWLDQRDRDEPFFLWLHYMDVHGPYQPATGNPYLQKLRSERRWRRAVHEPEALSAAERERLHRDYVAEVERTDGALDDLLDGLRARGLRDGTTIAVTADHGEAFGEHGSYSHHHELYDELLHVPLVLDGPEGETNVVDRPVELLHLAPTLCAMAGIDPPETMRGTPLPGTNDSPAHDGSDGPTVTLAEADLVPHYRGCVRAEDWKYIRDGDEERLYDLSEDPAETATVTARDDVAGRLADVLDRHLERPDRRDPSDAEEVTLDDEEVADRLDALGYIE